MGTGSAETAGTENTGDKGYIVIHQVFILYHSPLREFGDAE